jgi:hypothetical protein
MRVILRSKPALRSLSSLGRGKYSGRSHGGRSLGLRRTASREATLALGESGTT